EVHWFDWLESRLVKLGKVDAMSVFVALIVLMIAVSFANPEQSAAVLIAGVWGILIYLGVQVVSGMLEGDLEEDLENAEAGSGAATSAIMKGGIIGFLYLEVLDASFSFDGVIGAFAITNDVIVIMLGLAIGAMFVRSMTIFLVDKGTLDEF